MSWHRPRSLFFLLLAGAFLLSGCASIYVDTATKDVSPSEIKTVSKPLPAKLTFEFQTKGAPNAIATAFLKDQVSAQINSSGLFSSLNSDQPNSAVLSVVINNIEVTSMDDAAAKGFALGLTVGLAGSTVTDGYICTIQYMPIGSNEIITATSHHAIHTALGNTSPPANAVKAKNGEEAVQTMVRQILANALKDLSHNPKFN